MSSSGILPSLGDFSRLSGPLTVPPRRLALVTSSRHRDDDVALLVPLVDVPVCCDDLFERVAPIDDGTQLVSLDQAA